MPGRRRGDISETARRRLELYLDELERWRPRVSLSTVPRAEAWERHVVESARLLELSAPSAGADVIDVGAGGGVPGVIIAVVRPDLRVTLLEPDARKAGFLIHVCGLLDLAATVDCRRAEDAARDPASRERWDVSVSRAAAPPAELCELAMPLLRVGGSLWALVAQAAAAAAACAALDPSLGISRADAAGLGLLHVAKGAPTHERYPRAPAARRRAYPPSGVR